MEIAGKLIKVLPISEGTSTNGHWVRGGFVIETEERYPRKLAFSILGEDKVKMIGGVPIGTKVQVSFSPESREYQDRWYTELRCFSLSTLVATNVMNNQTAPQQSVQANYIPVQQTQPQNGQYATETMETDDDLPF